MLTRRAPALGIALLIVGLPCALSQPKADLDRTDPVAVANAYVEACRSGDLEAALALVAPDDPLRKAMAEAVEEMGGQMAEQGFTLQGFLTEFLFMPMKLDFTVQPGASQTEGDVATVHVNRSLPIDQQLLLHRTPDGTWQVQLVASIKATTGRDRSFLEMQTAGGGGGGGPDIWSSYQRLRTLYEAFEEYARDHGNRYPPAGKWTDEIGPYVLDREAFKCPAAPDLEHGYAMNIAAGEQPIPNDWQERQKLLLLFEWPGGQRNASAMPEGLATIKSFRPDGSIAIMDATGNARSLREGMTFAQMTEAEQQSSTCYDHLRKLAAAARRYARDNGGMLPAAESWQDDLAPYLLDEPDADELCHCPAAPDLEYAYAINEEIAGKNATELTGHGTIVLFFESDLNVPQAAGSPEREAPTDGRHLDQWSGRRQNHVAHLDGNVGSEPAPK